MMNQAKSSLAWMIALTLIGCSDDDASGEPLADDDMMEMGAEQPGDPGGEDPTPDAGPPAQQDPPGQEAAPPAPTLGRQLDRAGRAAVSTALIQTFNSDDAARNQRKDEYNAADSNWEQFQPDIAASLAILDSLDTVCGNQLLASATVDADRYSMLAGILSDDQLYVNSGRGECGVYLGAEAELVGAVAEGEGGCGGRTLADDVVERSYSLFAAGALTGVDDGVTADDGATTDGFPWLAPPASP